MLPVLVASCGPSLSEPEPFVRDANFPTAMAPLPGGGLRYGERLTGLVREVDRRGVKRDEPVAAVAVSTKGQRGLLGLAVDDQGRTFAAWTDPTLTLLVGQVAPPPVRIVWRGPHTSKLANGGRIAFAGDGGLVIGVGELQDPRRVDDPGVPNGKMLKLDPDGPPGQAPRILSSGWHNPFAFAFTPSGRLWVADNAPGDRPERLARADDSDMRATTLPSRTAPSGLAALSEQDLVVCGYVSHRLLRYRITGSGRAVAQGKPLALDCSLGVVALADGRVAYATETEINLVRS